MVLKYLHVARKYSDRFGWMPKLIRVFAGRTCCFAGFVVLRLIYYSGAVVKLGITVNLGILGYLKIDRVISRFPVPVSQMVHRLDWKQFSIKTKSF